MRGLKLYPEETPKGKIVASFTDAWIETTVIVCCKVYYKVASFTDAWIETNRRCQESKCIGVASFTDAWIETYALLLGSWDTLSHLLQMRGLKPKWYKWQCSNTQVASFTDAWIETLQNCFAF